MKIYQVGGSVRDKLMHKTPNDFDYVIVGSTTEELLSLGYHQVGKNFPVFINPINGYEYALARKEIKTGPKHSDFKFIFDTNITLKEDLERRDFTCNALAYDETNNTIIDYHNGQNDIKNKILRHINSTHFVEDPLRILRLCRFAAQLDFSVAEETLALASKMVSEDMLKYLSPERIWQEIFKALQTTNFTKFLITAKQCGALAKILPEIDELSSVPESPEYHSEKNAFAHTILALQYAKTSSAEVKFAILMHDLGKLKTLPQKLPIHNGHHLAGINIIKQICHRLKIPNTFKEFAKISCLHHCDFDYIKKLSINELVDFASKFVKKTKLLDDFIKLCHADFYGRQVIINDTDKQLFSEKENILRQSVSILQNIRASDVPNFKNIKKDKSFAQIFHQHKVDVLQKNLNFLYNI